MSGEQRGAGRGAPAVLDGPGIDRGRRDRLRIWLPIVCVAAAALWLVLRIPSGAFDVLWAEDGRDFLGDAARGRPWALLDPYAGYLHLLPRLVTALLALVVPLGGHAVAVTIVSLAFVLAVAIATYLLAGSVLPSMVTRLGVAAVPVVLPALGNEVLGNLANLHTYCCWLALWILLAAPRRGVANALWSLVLLACMLTEVQAVLLVPIALLTLRPARPGTWLPVGATLLGAGAQVASMVLQPRTGYPSVGLGPLDVVLAWMVQTALPIVSGSQAANRAALADAGVVVAIAAAIPIVAAGVVVLVLGLPRERRIALALGFVSVGIMGGCILTSQQEIWRYSSFEGDAWLDALVIVRYGAASGMYAAALVPIALGVVARRVVGRLPSSATPVRAARTVLVAAFVALMVAQAPLTGSVREGGAQWSDEVARAQIACASGEDEATLEVAPVGWSGGGAVLPCSAVAP